MAVKIVPPNTLTPGEKSRLGDAARLATEAVSAAGDASAYYHISNAIERLQTVQKSIVFRNLA